MSACSNLAYELDYLLTSYDTLVHSLLEKRNEIENVEDIESDISMMNRAYTGQLMNMVELLARLADNPDKPAIPKRAAIGSAIDRVNMGVRYQDREAAIHALILINEITTDMFLQSAKKNCGE